MNDQNTHPNVNPLWQSARQFSHIYILFSCILYGALQHIFGGSISIEERINHYEPETADHHSIKDLFKFDMEAYNNMFSQTSPYYNELREQSLFSSSPAVFQQIVNDGRTKILSVFNPYMASAGIQVLNDNILVHIPMNGDRTTSLSMMRNEMFHVALRTANRQSHKPIQQYALTKKQAEKINTSITTGYGRIRKLEKSFSEHVDDLTPQQMEFLDAVNTFIPLTSELRAEGDMSDLRSQYEELEDGRFVMPRGTPFPTKPTAVETYFNVTKASNGILYLSFSTLKSASLSDKMRAFFASIRLRSNLYEPGGPYHTLPSQLKSEERGSDVAMMPNGIKKSYFSEFCTIFSKIVGQRDACHIPEGRLSCPDGESRLAHCSLKT